MATSLDDNDSQQSESYVESDESDSESDPEAEIVELGGARPYRFEPDETASSHSSESSSSEESDSEDRLSDTSWYGTFYGQYIYSSY